MRRSRRQAESYLRRLMKHFDYAGVLTIEFFVKRGRLIANEMAPRVHNSGHWTIEGAQTSQFENHLRAIVGLPLGQHCAHSVTRRWSISSARFRTAAQVLAVPDVPLSQLRQNTATESQAGPLYFRPRKRERTRQGTATDARDPRPTLKDRAVPRRATPENFYAA